MSSKSKNTVQETGRWIRVGAFSAGALLPLVNAALNRIRARQDADIALARERNAEYKENLIDLTSSAQSEVQEDLHDVAATLGLDEALAELQIRAHQQDLLRRTNDLRENVQDRSSKFSRALLERSGEVSHGLTKRSEDISRELAKRGSKVSQEWAKRSGEVSQELTKRSNEVSHELSKRGRQAQKTIAEQERSFWVALGFSFGLTAAGIVTFVLIRRRLQQPSDLDEAPIQISYATPAKSAANPAASDSRGGIYAVHPSNGHIEIHSDNPSHDAIDATTTSTSARSEHAAPADAAFVGVSSTKHYYPVETPLDQLAVTSEGQVDIIYFTSETEAQAQGFQAAEV